MLTPPKPCAKSGCAGLAYGADKYCSKHLHLAATESKSFADTKRLSSTSRGYGYKWQKVSAAFLREFPLCVECTGQGLTELATDVDHKIPHRLAAAKASGDQAEIAKALKLFWNRDNWQGLCKRHHSAKTAKGF